jgi:LETM1-like protein
MYPRTFLTSHFWSIQQRVEFQELFLKERTAYNKKIFRKLQENLDATENFPSHNEFNYVLGLLGSGHHPSASEILAVKDIFLHKPYKIDSLSGSHLVSETLRTCLTLNTS